MPSLFTRILRGELPGYTLFEDDLVFAILARDAIQPGHTLVIPRAEIDHFADVPDPAYTRVYAVAKRLAPAIKAASGCVRVGQIVVGLEVPHFHLHLVPLFDASDIDFKKGRVRPPAEMAAMQTAITAAIG